MRRQAFGIGVASGLILGLTIVASTALTVGDTSGLWTRGAPAYALGATSNLPSNADGSKESLSSVYGSFGTAGSPSHLSSLAAQPADVTGIVLLPILAALFLGLLLYRVSSNQRERN